MRAVLLEVPMSLVEERRRKGIDVLDEMWEGVLHMVPAPARRHQWFAHELEVVLDPIAKAHGLVVLHETAVYRPGTEEGDYRIPDLVVYRPEHASDRGVEGHTELAIEIRSPNDETYEKLDFYAEVGVEELLVVDLDAPRIELLILTGKRLLPAVPDPQGAFRLSSLGVTLSLSDTGAVRLDWDDGTAEIPF